MIFLWVALYGLTYTISVQISYFLHASYWITALAMMLYASFLILWLYRTGQTHKVGLCAILHFNPKEYLYFLPLIVLPLFNLLLAEEYEIAFSTAALMLSVSLSEEVFFRGFMLRFFARYGSLRGILITSVVFALFHGVNLVQNADVIYILMQILCAFAVSVCYCSITLKFGSLLPCVISHFFTNITGISNPRSVESGLEMLVLWICIAVYVCYGIWLCRKNNINFYKEI